MKPEKNWFSIKASADDAEITLLDEIGGWGISVQDFKREFDAVKNKPRITLLVNSIGGNVFDGVAMYNILSPARAAITVKIIGLAASIASVVSMAGGIRKMGTGTYLMIHDPWGLAVGDAAELRKTADLMDSIKGQIADIYVANSKLTKEQVVQKMSDETWFTAKDAIEAGLVHESFEQQISNMVHPFEKYKFRNMPEALAASAQSSDPPRTKRELEDALRELGFSKSEAVGLVAKGFAALDGERQDDSGSEFVRAQRERDNMLSKILRKL